MTEVPAVGGGVGRVDPGQSVAVLIGVAEYPRSDFPPVSAAHENVQRLASVLAGAAWGLTRPMRLVELIDADRATVLRTVADAGKLVGRQGLLLVYFVGHAEPVGADLCMAMADADRSNPRASMVTVADLVASAGGSRSDKRVLVLDCCYSGRAAAQLPGMSVKLGEMVGWYFIGAADSSTQASAPQDGETTLFTAALLRALEGVPDAGESLSPADIWRALVDLLPADHPPVHNDLAWADRLHWLKNRAFVPGPRRPVELRQAGSKDSAGNDGIPAPPALYAEPRYSGSQDFVGRVSQLDTLSDWAAPAEPHPLLLFEAIGGTGKSMLTWEWTTRHASNVRDDWAGCFWYSFYERGAVMADFCRRALAYMSGQPLDAFKKMKQPKLTELLLRQLHARPWLLILDGLERVLVAYHRYDAAQLPDEQAGETDGSRDPCNAIRPMDDELLRQLSAASPSKILITSRLVPRVLLNQASQPVHGVVHERLPGLRPSDAEAFLRACGVRGDSRRMQDFLQRHCDCHPLVTCIIAGLINKNYLPARGDFDKWAEDPEHGGKLNLANLDLVQKRNHILTAALAALPEKGRQLLWAMSLIPGALDYATIDALNPHRPPEPEAVPEPTSPEQTRRWEYMSQEQRDRAKRAYEAARQPRREYEQKHDAWRNSPTTIGAADALVKTVGDLEQRGLLQYDRQAARWDLHPVVRAVASNSLGGRDRNRVGQQIIDHFSQQPHNPYEEAESLDDLHSAMTVIRTLIHIGRTTEAWQTLNGALVDALQLNAEAHVEVLSLLRPLFPREWSSPPYGFGDEDLSQMATTAAISLSELGQFTHATELDHTAMQINLKLRRMPSIRTNLVNLSADYDSTNQLAMSERCSLLALRLAELLDDPPAIFRSRCVQFETLARTGRWKDAEEIWSLLDPMGRDWPRYFYRPGDAEHSYLELLQFPRGRLTEHDLAATEHLARTGRNRRCIRSMHKLRGAWRLARGDHALAVESLQETIRMANEAGIPDPESETLLALAGSHLQQRGAAREEAHRLSAVRDPAHLALAELWHALGDTQKATEHAKAAYRHAWADGEPYVRRDSLTQATSILQKLEAEIPAFPAYDQARHPTQPWENQVTAAIAELSKRSRRRRSKTDRDL